MSDYIKREDAIKLACSDCEPYSCDKNCTLMQILKMIPAADVVERKYGKWEFSLKHQIVACSICGESKGGKLSPFCPWCGAEMDVSQIYLKRE